LCRLATGGSFAVRQLYTDDEEVLFEAARPVLLNGIEEVISRPDLGDRAIFLTLEPIVEAQRRPESELWREFETARPRILGALLDAVVQGLRALDRVHLDELPRMADFAVWVTACETALWPASTFARAYAANRRAAVESIIEADPIATCVLRARHHGRQTGMDRKRLRPFASVCGRRARCPLGRTGMGQKSAGSRRSPAARADFPADDGHRNFLLA
jgi:hypothetical protein